MSAKMALLQIDKIKERCAVTGPPTPWYTRQCVCQGNLLVSRFKKLLKVTRECELLLAFPTRWPPPVDIE